jgi:hypothetical protein
MAAFRIGEFTLPTHRSQRRFSQRTTGLPWNLTFADAAKKGGYCGIGRSRMPTDDRDNFGAERVDPMVTNQQTTPHLGRPAPASIECQRVGTGCAP